MFKETCLSAYLQVSDLHIQALKDPRPGLQQIEHHEMGIKPLDRSDNTEKQVLYQTMYPSSAHSFGSTGMNLGMDNPWDPGIERHRVGMVEPCPSRFALRANCVIGQRSKI